MQKSRLQHRKAVTLDTEMWPWDNSRVDKLEKDVDGIRGDVTEIKENVNKEDMCYAGETTSRGLFGLVCSSRTSERGREGDCVKEGGGGEGKCERERALAS
jgi:hypothetical protein